MQCSLSGKTPDVPVVSKYGHIYEKSLLEKWLEANPNVCPITKQTLVLEDLIEVKIARVVPPRPTTATSIPAMLSLFQNEWDALMLETFSLKQQLESVRQELAHTLYQHDAACRVIARLIKERDDAKNTLANFKANGGPAQTPALPTTNQTESMEVETGITEEIKSRVQKRSQELAKDRKKRTPPESLASTEDLERYKVLSTVNLHQTTNPGILTVDIHPTKQNFLLTGGVDGSVIVYNRETKKIVSTLSEHSKKVTDVLFHPTQDLFFSTSADKTAKLWSSVDGNYKSSHNVKVHHGEVVGCSLQATGDFWITASADKTWAFHDIETANTLATVNSESAFTSIQFHPDGLIVGTGNADSAVKIWDIKTLKNVATFEGHKGKVVDIDFSENGYYLATAAEDNTVKLWDLRKLKMIQSSTLPEDYAISSVKFDYTGTYLAVSGSDIRLFIAKTLNHISTLSKHKGIVNEVKWGMDATFLASAGQDRALKIWGQK